jgi:predicted nuclease of predicted toxin-antitoxin system
VKFLIDAQLPPALARWLQDAGHKAQHVQDVGLREATDVAIWTHALNTEAIIVTKDEDFAARSAREATGPVIVWLRAGNTTNVVLRGWIELRLSSVLQLVGDGHRLIEVV